MLHLPQRGCDRFSADRGEMMSLALLMTFSTCDPFNKSVHIIHSCSESRWYWFGKQAGTLNTWCTSDCVRVRNVDSLGERMGRIHQVFCCSRFFISTEGRQSDENQFIYNLLSIFLSESRSGLVKTRIPSSSLTRLERDNQLASDVKCCSFLSPQTIPPFLTAWEPLCQRRGMHCGCEGGHGSQRTHRISSTDTWHWGNQTKMH